MGAYTLLMFIDGFLILNAYNSFVTTLNTNNVSSKTLWTESWLKSTNPVAGWYYLAYGLIFMNGITLTGFLVNLMTEKMLFFRITQFSLFYPVMSVVFTGAAYTNYKQCSSLNADALTGTSSASSTTTQYNSCKGGSDSEYGDSGTVAIKVNSDPYETWTAINAVLAAG